MVYAPKTGIKLPGTSGNYISTPDHADLDITGDICVIAKLALTDWTPGSSQSILAKWPSGGNNQSFLFQVEHGADAGKLRVFYSSNGTSTEPLVRSTTVVSAIDGEYAVIAWTIDVNNGNSQSEFKFWQFNNTWELLGNTVIVGSTVSFFAGTANLEVGAHLGGTSNNIQGYVGYVSLYNGIGDNSAPGLGTLVAEFDAAKCKPRYRDSTGKIWTLNGSNSTMEKI